MPVTMDKSMLDYYGIPHSHYLYHLLQNFCNSVYISLNGHQSLNADISYPYITDEPEYCNTGPMTALLSAWKK